MARTAALEPLTYTVPQLAAVLNVSKDLAYRLVHDGTIPTVPNLGRRLVVARVAVDAYLATHTHTENDVA